MGNRKQGALANPGNLGNGDIMALAFAVLMAAARSAQDDLKDIMETVKQADRKKRAQRDQPPPDWVAELLGALAPLKGLSPAHPFCAVRAKVARVDQALEDFLDAVEELELERVPDQLSDMSEQQQLRMQMLMERMSKAAQMASNVMKKTARTTEQIVANMK